MKHLSILFSFIFLFCTVSTNQLCSLEVNRVILATDDNPMYYSFWPFTATIWKAITGLTPTLFLVASEEFMLEHRDIFIDQDYGDVIRIDPIDGISTITHAQVIRLAGPAYFPNEGCILSDIDMIPLSKDYFTQSAAQFPDDHFVVFREASPGRYAMCYVAAKGKTYAEVFGFNSTDQIPDMICQWITEEIGWSTDEILLSRKTNEWEQNTNRFTFLNHPAHNWHRVDRDNWGYDINALRRGEYIDSHMLRPFNQYFHEIIELVANLEIDLSLFDWEYIFQDPNIAFN